MLKIELVDRDPYIQFVEKHPLRNFLQYPSWSDLKTEWKWSSQFVGWFNQQNQLVGAANILYRKVPGLNKYLAYIPRGPLIDWFSDYSLQEWFNPLFNHLKRSHAFSVKIDPPLIRKRWTAEAIREHLSQFRKYRLKNKKLTDILPSEVFHEVEYVRQELAAMGWKLNPAIDSFDTVQPQFVYRLSMKGKTLEEIYNDFHPLWQERIFQAENEGIQIELGTEDDLPNFHQMMVKQGEREGEHIRELDYFMKMFEALTFEDPHRLRLYLAKQGDRLICASLAIRVEGHTWDIYGVQGEDTSVELASILLRWKMIQDAHQMGDQIFDFRGVSIGLDEQDADYDLLKFKLGFSGEACELMGEWDFPVIPMLHWAFDMYMKRR
ncbi:Lipid II:glycine glycyltransferase (Peptidoglycan interpeptide bridge formation enzyme) [Seinonella peptonophila]|uniref:Lipid II:glycine glycyltransferase n=1 Tax=Seinonella peptonophila TaxID=112248 RepID=A0A1M4TVB7_9BACL|nr:peptidoglycan bridge formation glycyltransferase FemA/FemB family protein [Seinonella peptonophila]SHE48373.1 Lipid II:glycine glycyltransferase (Peptidoglycan interpeptide bridge formation enzyme) [Seinonella peptonophila]